MEEQNSWTALEWTAQGRAEGVLPFVAENSMDALVCDPPGGIAFMQKAWDQDHGGRDAFIAKKLLPIFQQCLRVLKPGAYGLVWALPRTAHWTAWALEEAGFEIRDVMLHLFSTGFPKNMEAGRAIDKHLGKEREVIGTYQTPDGRDYTTEPQGKKPRFDAWMGPDQGTEPRQITAPTSEEARQWDGWGTAMKPAAEHYILVRKPTKLTVAENLLTWGVGAMNIAGCEIGRAKTDVPGWHVSGSQGSVGYLETPSFRIRDMSPEEVQAMRGSKGRHPSHLLFSHHPDCVPVGEARVKGCPPTVIQGGKEGGGFDVGSSDGSRRTEFAGYGDAEGMETVTRWACVAGCPVRELAEQSGASRSRKGKPRKSQQAGEGWGMTATGAEYADQGTATRFFKTFPEETSRFRYQAKPSRRERESGLLGFLPCAKCGELASTEHVDPGSGKTLPCIRNDHPTVKSVELMRYFVRLVCPPGGRVLDPFMGSGSTGVAATLEGMGFCGIEEEARSYTIARARLRWARAQKEG